MSLYTPLEVGNVVQGLFKQQCIEVSICTLLVFDTLITVDKEIEYFWTGSWYHLTHIIFFINRYVGIMAALAELFLSSMDATSSLCQFGLWAKDIGSTLIILILDYILVLRVLALWENDLKLSITLKTTIACETIAKIVIIVKSDTADTSYAFVLAKGVTYCATNPNDQTSITKLVMADWAVTSITGFVLFVLALYKAFYHWKSVGMEKADLMNIIIKDQIIYFFVALFCSVINIVDWIIGVDGLVTTVFVLDVLGNPVLLCLLGSRMFINLKEAGKVKVNEESNEQVEGGSPSSIDFAVAAESHSDM